MRNNINFFIPYLILILIIPYSAAYSGSESGYEIKLLTPNDYADTSVENPYIMNFFVNPGISGLLRTEGNFQVGLNIYPGSMGGEFNERGYKLFLVPEKALVSYSQGITTNDPGAGGNEPVADCGPDKPGCDNVGASVQFNGSASYDPDGTAIFYYWEFGDGTNATIVAPEHTYASYKWNGTGYGPFIANLTITDAGGLTNTTSQKVFIWMAGDANGDGNVNILDASVVGLKWGGYDPCADLNNDGSVNILDASIIGLNWGKSP